MSRCAKPHLSLIVAARFQCLSGVAWAIRTGAETEHIQILRGLRAYGYPVTTSYFITLLVIGSRW
jgi:hypothetical protein